MLNLVGLLAYSVNIQGHGSFCFSQKTTMDSSLSVTYYCVEGGKMTVQATLLQNGKQLERKDEMPSANFYIDKTVTGEYRVCLYNSESEAKQVTFFLQYTEMTPQQKEEDELSDKLLQIQQKIGTVHQFQRQSQQIERRLETVMLKTQGSVKFWTVFKFVIIVSCAAYQIWSFKRYFDKKNTAV